MIKDEMVGWHHHLDGHGFGWTLGVGDGQETNSIKTLKMVHIIKVFKK